MAACQEALETEDIELIRSAVSPTAGSPAPNSEPIKVLLWNIFGPGYAEARRLLVPAIVNEVDPDVLLLQETKERQLMNTITNPKNNGDERKYKDVLATDSTETRVIYDANKYSLVNQEKLFLKDKETLEGILKISIESVLSAENMVSLRKGKLEVLKDVFENRISIAGLRRKDSPASPVVAFLSFHNVHKSKGADVRARAVEGICQIVSKIRDLTECVVLAGADFNQQLTTCHNHTILKYTPTDRRLKSGQIDYFILDPPDCVRVPVKPWNYMEASENANNPLNATMTRLLRENNEKTGKPYTITEYDKALDHDPLVCEL